jgi:hypothetical protein
MLVLVPWRISKKKKKTEITLFVEMQPKEPSQGANVDGTSVFAIMPSN